MQLLLQFSVLLLWLMSAAAGQANTRQCLVCASSTLKNRWGLTGLNPATMTIDKFGACEDPTQAARDNCNGPCITYMFQDPDVDQTNQPTILFVRGCHSQLTGVVSDRTTSGGATNGMFCEFDSAFNRLDSRGKLVATKTLVEFCGSTDNCNTRTAFPNGDSNKCSGQTFNSTIDGAPLNCYDCEGLNENCFKSSCSKKYCAKAVVKLENAYVLRKSCSDVNVLGVDNACAYLEIPVEAAGAVALPTKYSQCYCKDKQYCSASPTIDSLSTVFFSASLAYFLSRSTQ